MGKGKTSETALAPPAPAPAPAPSHSKAHLLSPTICKDRIVPLLGASNPGVSSRMLAKLAKLAKKQSKGDIFTLMGEVMQLASVQMVALDVGHGDADSSRDLYLAAKSVRGDDADLLREEHLREREKATDEDEGESFTTCRAYNCNSRLVSFTARNTRSGDEGATIFFHCRTCKHRWVMYN